jgi:hypothetical protein
MGCPHSTQEKVNGGWRMAGDESGTAALSFRVAPAVEEHPEDSANELGSVRRTRCLFTIRNPQSAPSAVRHPQFTHAN